MQNYNKRKQSIIIGYLVLAISIGLLSYNYLNEKKEKVFNDVNLEYYALANPVEAKDDKIDNLESDKEEVKEEEEPIVNNYSNYFIGILDIPKINLSRGFVNPSSSENNVDKNIEIGTSIKINAKQTSLEHFIKIIKSLHLWT